MGPGSMHAHLRGHEPRVASDDLREQRQGLRRETLQAVQAHAPQGCLCVQVRRGQRAVQGFRRVLHRVFSLHVLLCARLHLRHTHVWRR